MRKNSSKRKGNIQRFVDGEKTKDFFVNGLTKVRGKAVYA